LSSWVGGVDTVAFCPGRGESGRPRMSGSPELSRTSISEHFATLTDPRGDHLKVHRLVDIVTIVLCAVICGVDDWVAVETFGRAKEAWLRTFLALPGGIPSHDTFGRVFARLNPDEFRCCFLAWARAVVGPPGAQVVAVDGKTVRRSHDRRAGEEALHLVSAWASASGLVLGQVATDARSNEITAIPALLRLLVPEGATVTIDAMGCLTAVGPAVTAEARHYLSSLPADAARPARRSAGPRTRRRGSPRGRPRSADPGRSRSRPPGRRGPRLPSSASRLGYRFGGRRGRTAPGPARPSGRRWRRGGSRGTA
jgi:hypothetical protein